MIEQAWRCTSKPSSIEILGYLEAVELEAVDWEEGAMGAETLLIG